MTATTTIATHVAELEREAAAHERDCIEQTELLSALVAIARTGNLESLREATLMVGDAEDGTYGDDPHAAHAYVMSGIRELLA